MKILQVGMSYNPGGVESYVMNYYRELVKLGIQYDFVSMFPKLAYENEIKQLGGRIFHISNVKNAPFQYANELTTIIESGNYEVIHVNMLSAANIVPLRIAHKCGVKKIIAHSHNSSTPGIIRNMMHRWNRRYVKQYATDCFACSKTAGEWLFSKHLMQADKFHIVNNALDLDKFYYDSNIRKEMRKELQIENKFVIGHVGRFEEQKNHKFLIEIFAEILKKDEAAVLLLVGNGELEEQVKKNVIGLGLVDKVIFTGVRADVNRILQAIDIFVFPSFFEGLPIVALEAQAAGVTSVLSDSITEEVKIMKNVEFFSLNQSAAEWAKAIVEKKDKCNHVNNDEIKEAFRASGYEIKSAAEKLLNYYKE